MLRIFLLYHKLHFFLSPNKITLIFGSWLMLRMSQFVISSTPLYGSMKI